MGDERLFLDTVFVQALLNRRDQHHPWAVALFPRLREAAEVWTTEAVLVEVANALSTYDRVGAAAFIQSCYATPNMRVVSVDRALFQKALQLYRQRPDKAWGLTDCISFTVMADAGIVLAATTDRHFVQAGFRTL